MNSFDPLIGCNARVLVLGTMPGQASLEKVEYYAHPQNAFWPIALAHILKEPVKRDLFHKRSYQTRTTLLANSHIALWDVLAQCDREGSLDSKIVRQSELPNPINDLLTGKPHIKAILFNGKTAEKLFKRHINIDSSIAMHSLPSTSPAMASLTLEEKYAQWRKALDQYCVS